MNKAFRRTIDNEKQIQTRSAVELAYAVVAEQYALETSGKQSRDEAQAKALNTIRAMRFGKDGYLWINDLKPAMVMHPTRPELNGKDLSSYSDPKGMHIFLEFVNVVTSKGSGYVAYMWPKPGESAPVRKISFVKGFAPWGWVIGTGIYADDIDAAAAQDWESGIRNNKIATIVVMVFALFSGVLFFCMVRQINRTLGDAVGALSQGAEQVASAAAEISSSSQDLAQGASEQAASLEETSASSKEINSLTARSADHSKNAVLLMNATAQRVEEGNRKLRELSDSMTEISTSGSEISKIIRVIDEIAFQTNILALNAAIEAARAGDAGLGFGVVADEVRRLAQRSGQAASDTSHLIEDSISKSQAGQEKLKDVATAIAAITEDAGKVKELIDEINLGSQEQARGMDQITSAMTQMEQITQKNAAGAEQSAAAGMQLDSQSDSLRSVLKSLAEFVGVE
jgi:methyl-accepting chemotaxis protein